MLSIFRQVRGKAASTIMEMGKNLIVGLHTLRHATHSTFILDYIFSFLVSDGGLITLIACSKDPVLSPIVERHVYYHVIVEVGVWSNSGYAFKPNHLSELVSKNPQIVHYVQILEIDVHSSSKIARIDGSFATTLLMFPALQCIKLSAPTTADWRLLNPCRTALEDRLNLPTIKEPHIRSDYIPSSLLNNKNIKNLSLSTSGFVSVQDHLCSSTLPQLHSLQFLASSRFSLFPSWLKLHCKELRSFECTLQHWGQISGVLGVCSGTLNNLDFVLGYSSCMISVFLAPKLHLKRCRSRDFYFSESITAISRRSSLPRTTHYPHERVQRTGSRLLQVMAPSSSRGRELIHILTSPSIHRDIMVTPSSLTRIDFSPLAALGAASQSISRIDLYVHTVYPPSPPVTHAQLMSSLEIYEDVARLIKAGVLVIYPEKIAPGCA